MPMIFVELLMMQVPRWVKTPQSSNVDLRDYLISLVVESVGCQGVMLPVEVLGIVAFPLASKGAYPGTNARCRAL